MWAKLQRVRPAAWLLVGLVAALGALSLGLMLQNRAQSSLILYGVQPVGAVLIALAARALSGGASLHVRHAKDKAVIIGAVIIMWFVACFAFGILTTYVHNALFSTAFSLLTNILAFALPAAAIEYTRAKTMAIAGRRNLLWFGAVVALVFSVQQMNLLLLANAHSAEAIVKVLVADIIPALVMSVLLTYLAAAAGLVSMLVLRLGTVAFLILPPIVPKFDWYLTGITTVLLAVAVYLIIDRTQQAGHQPHTRRHLNIALEATWGSAIIALVLFMTGVFAYKPSAIMSDSMAPTFTRGSMVIMEKKTDKMDIGIGDIIQYEGHGTVITHRVIALSSASDGSGELVITTKGDNNPSRDEPIRLKSVLGRVKATVPYIGYPTVWLRELTAGNKASEINK